MITVGIDVGSRNIKVAILKDGEIIHLGKSAGGFEQKEIARALYESALKDAGLLLTDVDFLVATGMGRHLIDYAELKVTDVTSAAQASAFFFPGAKTVVAVGAEESRGIRTDGAGRVVDSAVNEKCAAGSGSFTESMARALGMDLHEFGEVSLESTARIPMNAQCTVFAESEVVSLIHRNIEKKDIARAVNDAIASRVSSLVRRVGLEGEVVLLGGLAYNKGFVKCLMENLEVDNLKIPGKPDFADAVGAAHHAVGRITR